MPESLEAAAGHRLRSAASDGGVGSPAEERRHEACSRA